MKKVKVLFFSVVVAAFLPCACVTTPEFVPSFLETLQYDKNYLPNINQILSLRLPIDTVLEYNGNTMGIYSIQMISDSEVLLFYGWGGRDPEIVWDWKNYEIYSADFSKNEVSRVKEQEKDILMEYKSNTKNFRKIPQPAGQKLFSLFSSYAVTSLDLAFELFSFDRSQSIFIDKLITGGNKQGNNRYKTFVKLDFEKETEGYNFDFGLSHFNACLSPNSKYLTLDKLILNRDKKSWSHLFDSNQLYFYSISPSWSKIAIFYADSVNGTTKYFIGICDFNVE